MKVLYIHQYFRRPAEGGTLRSYHLAKTLVENKVEVNLVTSHNHNAIKVEDIEGIKVHFLPVYYDNKYGFLRRIFAFVKFMILSYRYCAKLEKPDYCYATSTPLTVGITAVLLKKINKIPYIFEVRDLWPEAPIQMGAIRNSLLKKVLYFLEKKIYANAEKIVALSPGMKAGIEQKVKNKEITIIPNMSDCEYLKPEIKNIKDTFYFGVGDKLVVTYIGAIGKVNNVDSILNVAELCLKENLNDVAFLISGRGSELKKLRSLSEQKKLSNVRFLGFLDRIQLKRLLNVSDISFISFADKPILGTNSPNKFFDSIAAGKVCVVNNKGWIRDLIEQSECGFYYNPKHPMECVNRIKELKQNQFLLKEQQRNARILAETNFSKNHLTKQFIALFDLQSLKQKTQQKSKAANARA